VNTGGSETNFAQMMTAKARALGMNGTVFRNANGLPDRPVHHRAHDMAVLGIALREHFPQYYGYFSGVPFSDGRQRINNHNRLLAASRVSTVSRPATLGPPASILSRRWPTVTAALSPSSWVEARAAAATARWQG
jgi:D-alanyl-D-alanine carboxypeptidase